MNQIVRLVVYTLLGAYATVAIQSYVEQRHLEASETQTIAADDAREQAQQ